MSHYETNNDWEIPKDIQHHDLWTDKDSGITRIFNNVTNCWENSVSHQMLSRAHQGDEVPESDSIRYWYDNRPKTILVRGGPSSLWVRFPLA